MNDSDLSPALTTTTLKSTRTTSAVMSSPCRISCRESDSSNRAAKFSAAAGAVVVWVAVAIRGWFPFENGCPLRWREPFFSPATGWSMNPYQVRRQKRANTAFRSFTSYVVPVNPPGARACLRASRFGRRCPYPVEVEDGADRRVDREIGRIQDHGIVGRSKRCSCPAGVARVALADIAQKTVHCNGDSFCDQLLMPALCALLHAGRHESFDGSIRKHDRPHVAAFRDETRRLAECPLAGQQRATDRRMDGDLRSGRGYRFAATVVGRVCSVETDTAVREFHIGRVSRIGEGRFVVQRNAIAKRVQCDEPVKGSAVQIAEAEVVRDARGDRSFSRRCRPVDRNDGCSHVTISASASK